MKGTENEFARGKKIKDDIQDRKIILPATSFLKYSSVIISQRFVRLSFPFFSFASKDR